VTPPAAPDIQRNPRFPHLIRIGSESAFAPKSAGRQRTEIVSIRNAAPHGRKVGALLMLLRRLQQKCFGFVAVDRLGFHVLLDRSLNSRAPLGENSAAKPPIGGGPAKTTTTR